MLSKVTSSSFILIALVVAVNPISIRVLVNEFQEHGAAHSIACVEVNIVKISKPNRKGKHGFMVRALDFQSGDPRVDSPSLPLDGFVFSGREYKSYTLCK